MRWPIRYATVRFQKHSACAAPSDRCLCRGMEGGLEGSQSLLGKLQTLKREPLAEQARTIELLAEQNLDVFDEVESLLASASDDSIFWMRVSEDREKVVRAALLAVLAADIATIPEWSSRAPYGKRLERLCQHFGVAYDDVVALVAHTTALERMLAGRRL